MKKLFPGAAVLLLLATLNTHFAGAWAQGTAFTYQGRLNANGAAANGLYDFRFKLALDPLGDTEAGGPYLTNAIPVANGLFMTTLDFGTGLFNGSNYWLEVDVRTNNPANTLAYTVLTPLQAVTPTPYAVFANTASNLSGTLSAAQIAGAVPAGSISGTYSNAVTLNNGGNAITGSFNGNGANVTNVNAAALDGVTAAGIWQTGGNNVTPGQVLGSTNNQPLAIYVGGQRELLITTNPADSANIVGGSPANTIDAGVEGAVIAGGGTTNFLGQPSTNHLSANFGLIGAGSGNWIQAGADHSAIVAGWNNTISGSAYESVIAGGENNTNGSHWAFLGGGLANYIQPNADYSVIDGGEGNNIQPAASESFIGGGYANSIQTNGTWSVIGGGYNNANGGYTSAILGGQQNFIQGLADHSTIAGGYLNAIIGSLAVNVYDFIGGGYGNVIQTNTQFGTIAGGISNLITAGTVNGTIGGGTNNYVNGISGTVAGGENNQAAAFRDTVGGGLLNKASGGISTVAGGWTNQATGNGAAIGGGAFNIASSIGAVVGGGGYNEATNQYAVVPGGNSNIAGGAVSFAAGYQAQAVHEGAFVWADALGAPFASTAQNQFSVRASGGVRLVTGGAGMTLDGVEVLTNSSTGVTLGGAFSGSLSGSATSATSFSGSLAGDVTGTQGATTVALVGGQTAANVAGATILANSMLFTNTSGSANFFAGPSAGRSTTGGEYNTGVGAFALQRNTGGSFNTAVGYETLHYNTTGVQNTAVGYDALWGLGNAPSSSGANNIGLGYFGGINLSGSESNNIEIGNSGVSGENNMIRIGTPGTQTNAIIAGVVTAAGGLQVGTGGSTVTFQQSGQAIMPSSSTQETNYTVAFPTAFSTAPHIVFTLANDPGFQGVSDVFASSVSSNSPAAFSINVYRLNGVGWSQQLRINWQAWQ